MPVRRHTDPIQVKLIWDAIRSSNAARQIPDLARITKYIQTIGNYSPTLIESFLKNALKDKLIVTNGKKQEGAVSSYKIVDQELPELDGKDWYCFECHLAGDVIPCVRCFRVFHAACVPRVRRQFEEEKQLNCESRDRVVANEKTLSANQLGNLLESLAGEDKTTVQYDENLCFLCNLSNVDFSCGMNREELNYMLRFVLHRIRAWMRRRLEQLPNKAEIIKCAMDCMQTEIDRITKDHNDHLKSLFESHNQQISETKKKQWCYNCEQDAIYHCCWNTAYCSQSCQQQHWQAEHKKVCRRKR
nr:unnamed protein product [Callosobruchus chinensis]